MSKYSTFADLYDLDQGGITVAEITMYTDLARQYGPEILELGCGTGRLTLPLAASGFHLVGVDNTAEMLSVAQRKHDLQRHMSRTAHVDWIHADATRIRLNRTFDMVLLANSLLLELDHGQMQRAALDTAFDHLRSGGCAIVEVMNPAHHDFWRLDGWTRTTVYNVEGQGRISLHASTRVDFERKIVRTHLAYNVISEMQETILFEGEVVQHCLAPNDLESLVAEKGFEIIGRFGSNLLEPFRPNSSSVCLLMLVKLAHLG